MVGTVVSADMDLIGQMQPNMPVRFVSVDMEAALAARRGPPECVRDRRPGRWRWVARVALRIFPPAFRNVGGKPSLIDRG